MLKQTFVVTLEVPSPFDRYFPKVEAAWIAKMVCDGIEAKSVSFTGPVPFRIIVERAGEASSVPGQMREYSAEEFEKAEGVPPRLVKAAEVALTK